MLRALVVVFLLGLFAEFVWLVDQLVSVRVFRSTHVVYFLVGVSDRGRDGTVLYVGSTNDVARRFAEHTSHDEPAEWRTRIHDIVRVRHCRSRRQARRIERRMIGAVVDGGRWRMCPPVHNVLLAGRSPVPSVSRLVWLVVYRFHGSLWPACRWHAPNLSRGVTSPVDVNVTTFPATAEEPERGSTPQTDPVIGDDSPNEGPFRDPHRADKSADGDTPPEDLTPPQHHRPLRVVPPSEVELPTDPVARKRERDRRNQAARRQRLAAEKQAADA